MKLLEYKAKEILRSAGIPASSGAVIDSPEQAAAAVRNEDLRYPVVVKAQVPIGGRGKAGGILFADNEGELKEHCQKLLGSSLRGYPVDQVYIVEKAEFEEEWYLSILLDRGTKCPLIIFSAQGGVEIEAIAAEDPNALKKIRIDPLVGVRADMARYLLSSSGLSLSCEKELTELLRSLYNAFCSNDCLLCEINPLAVGKDGTLQALDAKVEIDDSALFRLPDLLMYRENQREHPLVREARENRFLYIPVQPEGSIVVASNGSGMLMNCIDLISKEGMKVGAAMDLGGGATAERICKAIRILCATPGAKAVLINIFGGITRCDEVAGGIRMALEEGLGDVFIVLRMEGTNREQGLRIIDALPGDIIVADGLRESVSALTERKDRL